ncbi:Crp/Fnr family transcriptional regulator [Paenibacillus aceris]|uniref:CRP-like cAMP-binding protein n=1 Tax=Paenibacillus aceris TaxID=869555 RepID=A0ABS4I2G7_9BACL|nr:Crp/Fnr family transcriptional regulator [Paenibacillus aceris]MBP1965010.1 CRP-like cAMP-binding protein [Paenibacillus aceris]NHW35670.1 Crp/Fnr family transcriptional regulator [Paenibacillus aceris]
MVIPFELIDQWQQVLKYGNRQFFKKKSVIYRQGAAGDGFYFLHSGIVKIVASTSTGKERMLNIVVPGQLVGVHTIDRQTHFTTAITAKDSVLYHFSSERFKDLMTEQPELVHLVAQTIIQKMRVLLFAINMKTLSTEGQIALILLNLFDDFKNYEIPLSQQELANCTGLTRITVYKILRQWKEAGIIEMKERAFMIKRPDLLKGIVED